MTTVRIVQAEPRPGRMPDGRVLVGRHLVVLADDAGHRALLIRLPGGDAGFWRLLARPEEPSRSSPARRWPSTAW